MLRFPADILNNDVNGRVYTPNNAKCFKLTLVSDSKAKEFNVPIVNDIPLNNSGKPITGFDIFYSEQYNDTKNRIINGCPHDTVYDNRVIKECIRYRDNTLYPINSIPEYIIYDVMIKQWEELSDATRVLYMSRADYIISSRHNDVVIAVPSLANVNYAVALIENFNYAVPINNFDTLNENVADTIVSIYRSLYYITKAIPDSHSEFRHCAEQAMQWMCKRSTFNSIKRINVKESVRLVYGMPELFVFELCNYINSNDVIVHDFIKELSVLPMNYRIPVMSALVMSVKNLYKEVRTYNKMNKNGVTDEKLFMVPLFETLDNTVLQPYKYERIVPISVCNTLNMFGSPFVSKHVFTKRYNNRVGTMFDTFDWSNVILAGGFLTDLLRPEAENGTEGMDIDLFVYGIKNTNERKAKLNSILQHFNARYDNTIYIHDRSVTTLTIPDFEYNVQIVFTSADTPLEVVAGFDMTHINCYYRGKGHSSFKDTSLIGDVYICYDAIQAYTSRVTTIRPRPSIKCKMSRIYKALQRNFSVGVDVRNYVNNTILIETVMGEPQELFDINRMNTMTLTEMSQYPIVEYYTSKNYTITSAQYKRMSKAQITKAVMERFNNVTVKYTLRDIIEHIDATMSLQFVNGFKMYANDTTPVVTDTESSNGTVTPKRCSVHFDKSSDNMFDADLLQVTESATFGNNGLTLDSDTLPTLVKYDVKYNGNQVTITTPPTNKYTLPYHPEGDNLKAPELRELYKSKCKDNTIMLRFCATNREHNEFLQFIKRFEAVLFDTVSNSDTVSDTVTEAVRHCIAVEWEDNPSFYSVKIPIKYMSNYGLVVYHNNVKSLNNGSSASTYITMEFIVTHATVWTPEDSTLPKTYSIAKQLMKVNKYT